MNKLAMISVLAVTLLASMSVQAHGRHYDGDNDVRHKHHYVYKSDHPRHGHKRHVRVIRDGKHYDRGHHWGHGHRYYGRRHHDDGSHWGIVLRYFD